MRVGPLFSEWAALCPGSPPEANTAQTIGARSGASRDSRAAQRAQRWPPQVDATSFATPPTGLAGPALRYIGRKRAFSDRAERHLRPSIPAIGYTSADKHSRPFGGLKRGQVDRAFPSVSGKHPNARAGRIGQEREQSARLRGDDEAGRFGSLVEAAGRPRGKRKPHGAEPDRARQPHCR